MSAGDPGARNVQARAFLYVDAPTPVRAWSGAGPYRLPADAVDLTGGRYLGVGMLRNWPAIEGLINGTAQSITFELSGVDARAVKLTDESAPDVEGCDAWLGVQFCGPRYARRDVWWLAALRVDQVGTREVALDGLGAVAVERSVSVTLGSAHTSRRRSQPVYWDHATRQRLFPGDMGMSLVARYGPSATRPWPPKH